MKNKQEQENRPIYCFDKTCEILWKAYSFGYFNLISYENIRILLSIQKKDTRIQETRNKQIPNHKFQISNRLGFEYWNL